MNRQERIGLRRRLAAMPVDDSRCPKTGKRRHLSEDAARIAASAGVPGTGQPLFVYWCQACGGPHLTRSRQ